MRRPPPTPVGAIIEIIERGAKTGNGSSGQSVVAPNEIRLNGFPLLCPVDHPVTVHQIDMAGDQLAHVTLTLFARRVLIGAESDINAQPPLYGRGYFFAERDESNPDFPIRIQRRTASDDSGVVLDTYGVSVEHAEALISGLQTAIAQSVQDTADV